MMLTAIYSLLVINESLKYCSLCKITPTQHFLHRKLHSKRVYGFDACDDSRCLRYLSNQQKQPPEVFYKKGVP